MKYFLLVYDRRRGRIVDRRDYEEADRERALQDRAQLMREQRQSADTEVVLLGAESFDDLRKTHARYFKTVKQLAKTG